MALKMNTKAAQNHVKEWIVDNYVGEETEFPAMCKDIWEGAKSEMRYSMRFGVLDETAFRDWIYGAVFDPLYSNDLWVYAESDKLLAEWLEQTPEEQEKWAGNEHSCDRAIHMVYSVLEKEMRRQEKESAKK